MSRPVSGPVSGPLNGIDRRRFLLLTGGAGAGLLLAACSSSKPPQAVETPTVAPADHLEGDLAVAALLASLENLLVSVYNEGLGLNEKIGPVPPAIQAALETARDQHREHAKAWNGIITGAGKPGISGVNLSLKGAANGPAAGLLRVKEPNNLVGLCRDVEQVTATTYLAAIGALQNNAAVKVAASIHPVESAHVAVLSVLVSQSPAPDVFGRIDGARPTSDSIG
ncbi:MAG: ferritin-like domain-containing protein [Acidimicrobiales bacterium]